MLRAALAIVLFASCGGGRGPAWPKSQPSETDGGESLAPHQASSVAAIETADDDEKSSEAPAAAAPKPEKAEKPAEKPAEPAAPKEPEVIMTEEIVIEIED